MTGHPDAASTGQHLPVEHGTPEARRAAPTREERYAGALLGVHAGDALGATCEFQSWAAIRRTYPDGLRAIPTALAVSDRARRIAESLAISAITHDDVRCTVACAAYNEIAAALLDGVPADDSVEAGLACASELGQLQVAETIGFGRTLEPAVLAATGNTYLEGDGSGYVLDSLALAVAAVTDRRPFPDVLVDIVRVGNDTDTNAAIAGGLLGARDGLPAIPAGWVEVLQFREEFLTAAHRIRGQA